MATITRFEDLEISQLSRTFNKDIYPFLQSLLDRRNYQLHRQLDDATGSMMDNITEGFERAGNREFVQFLAISKASAAEVRSQLYRALDRNLIGQEKFEKFQNDCLLIANKIGKFITYLNHSDIRGKKFPNSNNKQQNNNPK